MKIFILISTIDRRILRVPAVLREPEPEVHYVVVWQQTYQEVDEEEETLTAELTSREDVTLVTLPGRGLSRSRNAAIKTVHSLLEDPLEDAVCIIADDDEKFTSDAFGLVNSYYLQHPDVDIALMRIRSVVDKSYFKKYPEVEIDYRKHPRSYYPCSLEMTFRARVWHAGIRFDERFGLGSPKLSAGEEEIFMIDAMDSGLRARIVPIDLGTTRPLSTGMHVSETKVLRSRGAVYGYRYSLPLAFLRTLREAISLSIRMRTRFIPVFRKIWYGVRYIRN